MENTSINALCKYLDEQLLSLIDTLKVFNNLQHLWFLYRRCRKKSTFNWFQYASPLALYWEKTQNVHSFPVQDEMQRNALLRSIHKNCSRKADHSVACLPNHLFSAHPLFLLPLDHRMEQSTTISKIFSFKNIFCYLKSRGDASNPTQMANIFQVFSLLTLNRDSSWCFIIRNSEEKSLLHQLSPNLSIMSAFRPYLHCIVNCILRQKCVCFALFNSLIDAKI